MQALYPAFTVDSRRRRRGSSGSKRRDARLSRTGKALLHSTGYGLPNRLEHPLPPHGHRCRTGLEHPLPFTKRRYPPVCCTVGDEFLLECMVFRAPVVLARFFLAAGAYPAHRLDDPGFLPAGQNGWAFANSLSALVLLRRRTEFGDCSAQLNGSPAFSGEPILLRKYYLQFVHLVHQY